MKGLHVLLYQLLFICGLFSYSYQQDCSAFVTQFKCDSLTSCMETSGVCQCKNGNQCVWTNSGNQRVNCPCYEDSTSYTNTSDTCENTLRTLNCAHETSCNPSTNTITCRCMTSAGAGKTCIYNDGITLNCPCDGTPPTIAEYTNLKKKECEDKPTNEMKCPEAPIHCMGGIGTCKCNDGTLCAWGPDYSIGCPCV